jgi:hypothetical protein
VVNELFGDEGHVEPEHEHWKRLLRDALAVLALPAEEQIRANGPGCVVCDLLEDFHHAHTVARDNIPGLSAEQRGLLDQIDATMKGMHQSDLECFNNDVLRRPV